MSELVILAAGAAVGGLVQGISGFAFAMVAMAIWIWGVDPQLAAVMAVFGGLTGQVVSVLRVRRGWQLGLLWPFLAGSALGIPLGTRLLPLLDPNRFKLVLGLLLVGCCSAMLLSASLPRVTHGGRIADAGAGLVGGLMAPLSGFSGLAPALWATLRGYTKDEHRAVLQNFNLVVLAATFASFVVTGRARFEHVSRMTVVALALVPMSFVGSRVYLGMSATAFRNTVLYLLTFAGATMVLAAARAMRLFTP